MLSPETLVSSASERIHTILDKLHTGLLVQDRQCAVEFVNQAFCDLFRLSRSPESLRGLSAQQMLPLLCGAYADPQAAAARLVAIVHADQPVHGEEVAIIGAGMAGMTAAYELMKMGLKPVIYEAGRIGGRLRQMRLPYGLVIRRGSQIISTPRSVSSRIRRPAPCFRLMIASGKV